MQKLGQRRITVGEIIFTDTRVPKDSLLSQKEDGFKILMSLLNNTRLFAASRPLGLLKTCLEKSIEYAQTRVQFGRPIGKFQMIQDQIAEIFINYEASKTMVYQAASNKDKGSKDVMEVSAAKYMACESAVKATNTAMRIYGAYGFSMEFPIQRYLRDSFGFIITEGSSIIQKVIIAKNLLNL